MDIRSIGVRETGTIHIRDASGTPLYDGDKPVTITVYGPGSKHYQRATAARQARLLERLQRAGKQKVADDDMADEQPKFLADCTHQMSGVELGEKSGYELFVAVYSEPSIGFIADQVAAFVGEWGNFTPASGAN